MNYREEFEKDWNKDKAGYPAYNNEYIEWLESKLAEVKQRWVPVTERLPEETMPVVYASYDIISYGRYNKEKDRFEEHQVCDDCGFSWKRDDYITHWMPIPELPEGEK